MTKIKICGLSRKTDIEYVNKLKPDYIGFVFAESRRKVTVDQAEDLRKGLDKGIKTVGVFVDEPLGSLIYISERLRLDVIQLHGNEDFPYIKQLSAYEIWKSIGISGFEDLKRMEDQPVETILVDSKVPGALGGTGQSFDWSLLDGTSHRKKIILAGGLNPQNVSEAIKQVKPFAVDVSSGVESGGIKDFYKIEEFIRKVRNI
ncbi:phosphoribosylanthranilate isomerase [Clostridium thermarum]|uniref:phosphoribosylanthranilate isomerase n=1 Tax=Clostridium thermarum TaxID=1716543 RepID=UPI00111FE71B|nr:phosphoribosylanthranilate isomerase [Clostridium thermarum]